MKYALLIYGDESAWATHPRGFRAGDGRLQPLRRGGRRAHPGRRGAAGHRDGDDRAVRDGERLLTDGPFAETREQLGGFYVIEAGSLDEALELGGEDPRRT